MPTEQCNFRCAYCYEDFSHGKMSKETINKIKSFITKRISCGLKRLDINWFGGEPLLATDVIKDIMSHAISFKDVCSVSGSMTTNGYRLTPDVLKELYHHNVRGFQITLDGFEAEHDKTRMRIGHKSSYQQIWNNISEIGSNFPLISVILRLHITAFNAHNIEDFTRYVISKFENDDRFSFSVQPVVNFGGSSFHPDSVLTHENGQRLVDRIRTMLPNKHTNTNIIPVCYASMPNSFLIRSNGTLAKCTVELNNPKNNVGTILDDGTIDINSNIDYWMRGFTLNNNHMLSCPAHYD